MALLASAPSARGRRAAAAATPAPAAPAPAVTAPFVFDGIEALRALRLLVRVHEAGGRIRMVPSEGGRPACLCIEPAAARTGGDVYGEALLCMPALSRLLDPWDAALAGFLVEAAEAHVKACLARASAWRDVDGAFERLTEAEPHLAHEMNVHVNAAEAQASAGDWKALARSIVAALDVADAVALVNLRPASSVVPDVAELFGGRR